MLCIEIMTMGARSAIRMSHGGEARTRTDAGWPVCAAQSRGPFEQVAYSARDLTMDLTMSRPGGGAFHEAACPATEGARCVPSAQLAVFF